MYTELFQDLGLAKNEARVYETLLRFGELSIGEIAAKSKVNRRNVYDTMHRLLEKGLVFEIIERKEARFQAVEPSKLYEIIKEKEQKLKSVMPELNSMFASLPSNNSVFVYRGIEGWQNYMRDILRLGEDFYSIAAKGAWWEERLKHFTTQFIKEAKRKKIKYYHLLDYEIKDSGHPVLENIGKNYKFLPEKYSTPASVDFFGDRVNICSSVEIGGVSEEVQITVIKNPIIADSFRNWFQFMWDFCPE
jgi:sugar-specific transcriptional regulator TrmB